MRVALLTNGPGELWGWVRPVIAELRKREHSVSLWLLPCQYASGYERAAASNLGADKLEGPYGSAYTWRALANEKTDCVLQLGGDLLFGRRLADCAKTPLLCYAYGYKKGMKRAQVFTAYHEMAESIGEKLDPAGLLPHIQVIGDLVKDSLLLETVKETAEMPERNVDTAPHVLLFPGSRPAVRNLSLKWSTTITRHMKKLIPNVRFTTLFSPFAPENDFQVWQNAGLNPVKSGDKTYSIMKSADYAMTQPGTNTLELMHCGLPALVAAPIDFLNAIPIGGLGGFVAGIPLIGPALKEWKLRRSLEQIGGFLSWPNRLAGREILDEAVGDVTPLDLAERAAASIKDKKKLSRVRGELLNLSGESGESGAAARLCDAVERAGGR